MTDVADVKTDESSPTPRRKLRRWLRLTLTITAAVLGLAAAWTIYRPASLLSHSHRLCSTAIQHPVSKQPYDIPWSWLDTNHILRTQITLGPTPGGTSVTSQRLYSIDVGTGEERYLDRLSDQLQPEPSGNGVTSGMVTGFRATADGRWLVAYRITSQNGHARRKVFAVSTDGATVRTIYDDMAGKWYRDCLLPDGRHWAALLYKRSGLETAEIHSVDDPKVVRFVPFTPAISNSLVPIGWLKDGSLLLGKWWEDQVVSNSGPANGRSQPKQEESKPVITARVDLSSGTATPVPGKIEPAAPGRITRYLSLSPDGSRLAWITYIPMSESSFTARISRWMPSLIQPSTGRVELWITNSDGSSPRLLGDRPAASDDAGARWLFRNPCGWSPDGKKIAFVYNHELWVTDAD